MKEIFSKTIRPSEKFSLIIGKNKAVKFTALGPEANLAINFYNQKDTSERYSMPDTLKAQHTAFLTKGNTVMSDDGRVLASFIEDTFGWHDTITALTTEKLTKEKYAGKSYQEVENDYYANGYDNFLKELMRLGMTRRDLTANINLFSKLNFLNNGDMIYDQDADSTGKSVTLRTDMDVDVIMSNTPNALNPSLKYPAVPIEMEIFEAVPADLNDYCVQNSEENYRAFQNTWNYEALV